MFNFVYIFIHHLQLLHNNIAVFINLLSYMKLCLHMYIYLSVFQIITGSAFNGPFISGSPQLGNCIEDGPRVRYWHLVKNSDDHHDFHKDHCHKAIPEIFLTRLLSTKVRKMQNMTK